MNNIDDLDTAKIIREGIQEGGKRKRSLIIWLSVLVLVNILGLTYLFAIADRQESQSQVNSAKPPSFLTSFKGDEKQGLLAEPLSAAVDKYGKIFLTDTGNGAVQVFDARGKYLFKFGQNSSDYRSNLRIPCYVAISPAGRIYISDRGWNAIFIFNREGEFIRRFLPNGEKDYEWGPLGLEFAENGDLFACDVINHKVLVFSSTGKLKNEIGRPGTQPGQFQFPNDIALAGDRLYVTDSNNLRVQVFLQNGRFIGILETGKNAIMGLPRGVAVSQDGQILVADAIAQQVHVFDLKNKYLYSFGSFGSKPHEFSFLNGVAVNKDNQLLIVDKGNNAVKVWGWQ